MAIKVEDTVLCINNKPLAGNDIAPPLKEGENYPVTEIYTCGCGKQHIGVGLKAEVNYVTCYDCEEKMPLTTHWCHPSRFEVVEEKGTFRLGTVEEAQAELCDANGFVNFVD